METIYENQFNSEYHYHNPMMTIKQLREVLGYERPIDLTRELIKRGVLEKKKGSGNVLTKAALDNQLGQRWIKNIAFGGKVGHNMFFYEEVEMFIKNDGYLPISGEEESYKPF